MPPSPQNSERPHEERFKESAESLYALLTSPFERAFCSEGYHARLTLPVSRDNVIHNEKRQSDFYFLTGNVIDKDRRWNLELGHLSSSNVLGITNLEIPLKNTDQEAVLIMRRISNEDYMLLYRDSSNEEAPYSSPIEHLENDLNTDDIFSATIAIQESLVKRILIDIGYGLPELFTTPDDLSLYMTNLMERTQDWTVAETVSMPTNDHMRVTVTRTASENPAARSRSTPRADRTNIQRIPTEIDSKVEAVIEDADIANPRRQQLIITYIGEEYSIKKPTIKSRDIELDTSDSGVARYGNNRYIIVEEKTITASPELLDELASGIVDDILGEPTQE